MITPFVHVIGNSKIINKKSKKHLINWLILKVKLYRL